MSALVEECQRQLLPRWYSGLWLLCRRAIAASPSAHSTEALWISGKSAGWAGHLVVGFFSLHLGMMWEEAQEASDKCFKKVKGSKSLCSCGFGALLMKCSVQLQGDHKETAEMQRLEVSAAFHWGIPEQVFRLTKHERSCWRVPKAVVTQMIFRSLITLQKSHCSLSFSTQHRGFVNLR